MPRPTCPTALGGLLGVKIEHVTVDGLPSQLTGIAAGRYDLALGPVGDFPDRQASNDFVDWVQEFVVFAVPKGNPKQDRIDRRHLRAADLRDGRRVGREGDQGAVRHLRQGRQAAGRGPVLQGPAHLDPRRPLRAGPTRFFSSQAPLTYFVKQSGGELELAGTGKPNGFDTLYQGAVVAKDSPLRDVLKDGIQKLIDDGTYEKVMTKWGTSGNMLKQAGVNLAAKQ